METSRLITGGILVMFGGILFSLIYSLQSLLTGRGGNKAIVNRLTLRISLAVVLLTILLLLIYFGIISPNPYVL